VIPAQSTGKYMASIWTALLLMDRQQGIVNNLPQADAGVAIIAGAIVKAKKTTSR
jgi:hypothetical protein